MMSQEGPKLAEGELKQLTDRLEETTLNEKDLAALIREANTGAKAGKDEGLENAIASVKSALQNKSVSLSTLMECKELLPVLISGLKMDSSKVQLDALAVVAVIFNVKDEIDPQKQMVMMTSLTIKTYSRIKWAIWSGITPALISLLASKVEAVCENALRTLMVIFKCNASLDHFRRDPNIIPALIKLVERVEKQEWLEAIAWISGRFSMHWECCLGGRVTSAEELYTLPVLRELINLFVILMGRSNAPDIIKWTSMSFTQSICRGEGIFGVIVPSGIVPLLADSLWTPNKFARRNAALAITLIGYEADSNEDILQFFQALQGSSGMKELWKNIFEDSEASDHSDQGIREKEKLIHRLEIVLDWVQSALGEEELRSAMTQAVIESGFAHTLVKFLEKEAPFELQKMAISILKLLMEEMEEEIVSLFLEMEVVPLVLEQLSSTIDTARSWAPVCLERLMKTRPCVRDEIVSSGGLQEMIRMLKKDNRKVVANILILLKEILRQMPKLPLEQFQGLAEVLKLLWSKNATKGNILRMISNCLKEIAGYGAIGIELIRTSGNFRVLIDGLSSDMLEVQQIATEVIFRACLLEKENRDSLLKLGVLDSFPGLIRNSSDKMIKLVLMTLKVFLDGKLSAAQTKAILGMKKLVEAELFRDLQVKSSAASLLLSKMEEIQQK